MFRHQWLVAVLVALPTLARAQGTAPAAPLCDGSEIRHAERTRDIGNALLFSTAAVDLTALLTIPRNPDGARTAPSHFRLVAATLPIAITGFVVARHASPGESFWERVITRMKVGETRAADVQLCLHRPDASASNTRGERWTYVTARPGALGGTFRTVRLTFRDSILTDVERTAVRQSADGRHDDGTSGARLDRRHGFCAPPIPVVADAFPAATDTTFAARSMARAQADADAASKNAQLQSAYAMCVASDSAQ